jgi:hypothetical protein
MLDSIITGFIKNNQDGSQKCLYLEVNCQIIPINSKQRFHKFDLAFISSHAAGQGNCKHTFTQNPEII